MKKFCIILIIVLLLTIFFGCTGNSEATQVVATTLPVYTFCEALCQDTGITVTQLIQDNVSCLHDYTLQVSQMRTIEGAQVVVINGAGLEHFLSDALGSVQCIVDSSQGIDTLCIEDEHTHEHEHVHDHDHSQDAHIWLSPANARQMVENICIGLTQQFPEYEEMFTQNLEALQQELDNLQAYGKQALHTLSTRELITFHDGFSYFAESFDLHILHAVEEEAGSETSAAQLIELIGIVQEHQLNAVFTETNGSTASADIVAAETGCDVYCLDMAISQGDYFKIMYQNIDTIKEALG